MEKWAPDKTKKSFETEAKEILIKRLHNSSEMKFLPTDFHEKKNKRVIHNNISRFFMVSSEFCG